MAALFGLGPNGVVYIWNDLFFPFFWIVFNYYYEIKKNNRDKNMFCWKDRDKDIKINDSKIILKWISIF